MMQAKHSITALCLILILIAGLTPTLARADEGIREDKPLRLYATAMRGPIGTVLSYDAMAINGREARGDRPIWGGEMIRAPFNNSAQVLLESVGQVILKRGAVASLATSQ